MADSEDEFDAYNLGEFTEQDFAKIDFDVLSDIQAQQSQAAGPAVPIEIEDSPMPRGLPHFTAATAGSSRSFQHYSEISPFQRHRSWSNILSVTDLVSPSWCEVQFDYGLRQKRSKRLEDRPASFTSGQGKEIVVVKKVAAENEVRLKRGKSVHKALEKEIRPVDIKVDIATKEERWAIRLVNMISSMHSLLTLGFAREMPVFGIVHDQIVVGVIDEITRKPIPVPSPTSKPKRSSESSHATPRSKRIRRTASSSSPQRQPDLTSFFSTKPRLDSQLHSTPSPSPITNDALSLYHPNFTLHILDTKTRLSDTLPDEIDTVSSRLQLMLYHRLLSAFITSLDFEVMWDRLGVNPEKRFSERFVRQARGIVGGIEEEGDSVCLNRLVELWRNHVTVLDISGVDTMLQVVYRSQPKGKGKGGERGNGIASGGKKKETTEEILTSEEEVDLALAIEESIKSMDGAAHTEHEHDLANTVADSGPPESIRHPQSTGKSMGDLGIVTGKGHVEGLIEDPCLLPALQQPSFTDTKKKTEHHQDKDSESRPSSSESYEGSKILGTKEFILDNSFLDDYLVDVLQWWHGQRPPKGVDMKLSRRCLSCEYMEGCEWREKKAVEFEASRKFEANYC